MDETKEALDDLQRSACCIIANYALEWVRRLEEENAELRAQLAAIQGELFDG